MPLVLTGWANPGGQDVTFVDDMLGQPRAGLRVDTTQIFAGGFSYGCGMSYALACARASVLRAVAVYSGAQLSGCAGPDPDPGACRVSAAVKPGPPPSPARP